VNNGCGNAAAGNGCGGCGNGCGGCGSGCGNGCGSSAAGGDGCGSAAPATRTVCRRVWVPNVVTQEVPVTTYKNETSEEAYTYNVTLCRDEVRQRTVKKCS